MLCFINGCFGMDDYEHGICVMNVLSLFTGAGGGELAFQHLLTGFRTIGYVEIDDYCQRIIRQRQLDGLLDQAPIFGDIRTFIDSGCCELYKGIADIVTAGFPCQPFSVAGKQLAEKDNRNLWPETIKTIRIIRPATVFLENVPGLLASEHALTIFRQLRENGYQTVPPLKLGADDIGANHRRKRIWIKMDYAGNGGISKRTGKIRIEGIRRNEKNRQAATDDLPTPPESGSLANSNKRRSQPGNDIAGWKAGSVSGGRCERAEVADTEGQSIGAGFCSIEQGKFGRRRSGNEGCEISDTSKSGLEGQKPKGKFSREQPGLSAECGWWTTEPTLGRVAHGVAHRVDRLKAIGNGQVPQVAATAWEILKPSELKMLDPTTNPIIHTDKELRARKLEKYLEKLLATHEIVPIEAQEALLDKIQAIRNE